MRPPGRLPEILGASLDQQLQAEINERVVFNAEKIERSTTIGGIEMCLWQGDITQLKIDAIVNAANSQLLGCFLPNHDCIDNAIHSAAGPRVREDCNTIMVMQGKPEATGQAKITKGYHLYAKYILHTVGPNVTNGAAAAKSDGQLADCYQACLNLSVLIPTIRSIAFCSISTGVFGFPKEQAARIAISSVGQWARKHPHALETIVFNVFQDNDFNLYKRHLTADGFI